MEDWVLPSPKYIDKYTIGIWISQYLHIVAVEDHILPSHFNKKFL